MQKIVVLVLLFLAQQAMAHQIKYKVTSNDGEVKTYEPVSGKIKVTGIASKAWVCEADNTLATEQRGPSLFMSCINWHQSKPVGAIMTSFSCPKPFTDKDNELTRSINDFRKNDAHAMVTLAEMASNKAYSSWKLEFYCE